MDAQSCYSHNEHRHTSTPPPRASPRAPPPPYRTRKPTLLHIQLYHHADAIAQNCTMNELRHMKLEDTYGRPAFSGTGRNRYVDDADIFSLLGCLIDADEISDNRVMSHRTKN
eukprot:IDg10224t1